MYYIKYDVLNRPCEMLKSVCLKARTPEKYYNDTSNQHFNLHNLRAQINYITVKILNFINFTGNDNIH